MRVRRIQQQAVAEVVEPAERARGAVEAYKDTTIAWSAAAVAQQGMAADYRAMLEENAQAAERAAEAQLGMAASLKGASEAQVAQAAMSELGRAQAEGTITFEQYATAVGETQIAYGLADEASVGMSRRIVDLVGRLGEGTVAATGV